VSLAVAADQREVTAVLEHCETGVRRSKDCEFLLDPHPKMPDISPTRIEAADLAAYIATLARWPLRDARNAPQALSEPGVGNIRVICGGVARPAAGPARWLNHSITTTVASVPRRADNLSTHMAGALYQASRLPKPGAC
jgi:hypothetical protein